MSPIIRINDDLYQRLESKAIGFDTPSNVIERLLNFWDKEQHSEKQNTTEKPSSKIYPKVKSSFVSSIDKKKRNPEKEKELKLAVGKSLNWGKFSLSSNTMLNFFEGNKKVLCKYSSYSEQNKGWFWGVGQKYLDNWDDYTYLALAMENDNKKNYSVLIIKPNDAFSLLNNRCSESNNEKKINLRFFNNEGKYLLQEWKEYDVDKNLIDDIY